MARRLGGGEHFLIRENRVKVLKREQDRYKKKGTAKRLVWLEHLNKRENERREDGEVRGSKIMWALKGVLNLTKNILGSSCKISKQGQRMSVLSLDDSCCWVENEL